jgi:YgiT-type zinc finger domain-containing protein
MSNIQQGISKFKIRHSVFHIRSPLGRSQAAPRCKYCGFDTHEDVIKAAIWTNKGLIVVEDIPARLCEGCGEQFFEEEITQRIQNVLTHLLTKAKRQIRVPVYSLSQVAAPKHERHPEVAGEQYRASLESTHHQAKRAPEPVRANHDCQEAFLCKYCESGTVAELVKSAFWVDGALLAIENIPARVCQRCRQQFYDEQVAEKIAALERRRSVLGPATRDVSVPVFSLADIDQCSGKRPQPRQIPLRVPGR